MARENVVIEETLYGRSVKVEVESLGKCPICGGVVFDPIKDFKGEPAKAYNCQKWFSKKCNFGIWKVFCEKKLTADVVAELLEFGHTKEAVTGLKSQKGTIFDTRLMLDKVDHKVHFFREESANSQSEGGSAEGDGSDE